jgi:chromosome partitioning protein
MARRQPRTEEAGPRLLAIANQKGGVGKTTVAVNLSYGLACAGKSVLLVDADPQGAATRWLMENESPEGSLADVLIEGRSILSSAVEVRDNLSLLPAGNNLATVEKSLAAEPGAELVLKIALGSVRKDFVVIDCPPSLGLLSTLALTAAQEAVVPLQTEAMALHGLVALQRLIDLISDRLSPRLHISAIVPTMYDARMRICQDILEGLKKRFGKIVLPPIRTDVRIKEAPAHGQPIQTYAPSCRAAEDFAKVIKLIMRAKGT